MLAVKACRALDLAIQGQSEHEGFFDSFSVDAGQRSRKSQGKWICETVGHLAEITCWARTEHLGSCVQLKVDFQANHRL